MSSPTARMSGGPIDRVQSARHRQLLEQYSEYLPVIERLQLELFETIDQLRDLPRGVRDGETEIQGQLSKWDEDTVRGLKAWAQDIGVSWRALRRSRFRQDKASELLLETLTVRASPPLHTPLPLHLQTYVFQEPTAPIFTILPPLVYSDRIGRPTGVLTLRQINRNIPTRNGDAGKEGIREFAWWIAELTRRVMQDWYQGESDGGKAKNRDNIAGGGCVLVVDAKNAGMKNLELELLPNLISINHNHFPSQFSTVYVLNHSWTHSGLWACIKRVLPQSALEKIVFIKGDQEIGDVFDLERFPREYGGKCDRDFREDAFWLYNTYGKKPISTVSPTRSPTHEQESFPADATPATSITALHVPSYESIADVFYSARNTPMQSAQASPVINAKIGKQRRRALRLDLTMTSRPPPGTVLSFVPLKGPYAVDQRERKSPSNEGQSITKVRSISDFQLYLSPSRVTNLDLLLSSDEEASDEEALQLESLRARQKARRASRSSLQPTASGSFTSPHGHAISTRSDRSETDVLDTANNGKAKRPAITPWISGSGRAADSMRQASWDDARSYSASLIRHHAKGLTRNRIISDLSTEVTATANGEEVIIDHDKEEQDQPETRSLDPSTTQATESDVESSLLHNASDQSDSTRSRRRRRIELPISAYDRMMNPMFGYPVLQTVSTSGTNLAGMLRPRYGRKRKRDLAKTLLFLFLLRMDSFRRWIGQATTDFAELFLTIIGLGGWFKSRNHADDPRDPVYGMHGVKTHGRRDPEQAFALARHRYTSQGLDAIHGGRGVAAKGDWLWMIITIVLVRGSWGRLLLSTLEELRRVRRVFTTNVH